VSGCSLGRWYRTIATDDGARLLSGRWINEKWHVDDMSNSWSRKQGPGLLDHPVTSSQRQQTSIADKDSPPSVMKSKASETAGPP
jgi:hypothetical protein